MWPEQCFRLIGVMLLSFGSLAAIFPALHSLYLACSRMLLVSGRIRIDQIIIAHGAHSYPLLGG